ncbi:JmjC domain-containing protein [Streptomyces goshikiensis]|uniref:JmjC domain-containing protein n=1 Tax=Streptomyces goshikiensis TaxID=1942 RepID=UPI00167564E4|nr:cupin domain-containing protein [Streptomyces goshikiensis]GHD81405.1 hypothetical protein GCM10010336_66580 [Streptomyces goshikiensis]
MKYDTWPPTIQLTDDFYARHWEKGPVLLRDADPTAFESVFTRESFDGLLQYGALRSGFVTVINGGRPVPDELLCREEEVGGRVHDDLVDPASIAQHLDSGATVILAGLQLLDRSVAELGQRLSADVGRRTEAHAFLTPPHIGGLARHFDGEDNFLLQLEGTKHWVLSPPLSDRLPVSGGHPPAGHPADERDVVTVDLRPGDLLYIPRGWLHASSTMDTASLHVTFQVLPDTARNVIEERVRRILLDAVSVDEAVPRPGSSALVGFAEQIRRTARGLEEWAQEVDQAAAGS